MVKKIAKKGMNCTLVTGMMQWSSVSESANQILNFNKYRCERGWDGQVIQKAIPASWKQASTGLFPSSPTSPIPSRSKIPISPSPVLTRRTRHCWIWRRWRRRAATSCGGGGGWGAVDRERFDGERLRTRREQLTVRAFAVSGLREGEDMHHRYEA